MRLLAALIILALVLLTVWVLMPRTPAIEIIPAQACQRVNPCDKIDCRQQHFRRQIERIA